MTFNNITSSAPAIIFKVDIDGNVVDGFEALCYNNSSSYILLVSYISVDTDSSFLIGAITTYF